MDLYLLSGNANISHEREIYNWVRFEEQKWKKCISLLDIEMDEW